MHQQQIANGASQENDLIEDCVSFFNKILQARLIKERIQDNNHKLKNIAIKLGLENEHALLKAAIKGNIKSVAAIEALLLRPNLNFFEKNAVYKVFDTILLPQLINKNKNIKKISIWIPGCTKGYEAYSFALLLHLHQDILKNWDIHIYATDTDSTSLKEAEKTSIHIEHIDNKTFKPYKKGLKKIDDGYMIRSDVLDLITFQQCDFYESHISDHPYDIIIFRDHLKYWQPDLQEKIIASFEKNLKPYGYLILGSKESLLGLSGNFNSITSNQGIYQKTI